MDLFTRKSAGAVKLMLIIHAVLLFAGLYAHLSTYRLYSVMPELYWHLPHPARDVQQLAILAQLCSFFMTALFFLLWTYRSYRHLSALSDRNLRFSPGWAVSWYFVPIMNLFRPYQVMKEIWEESDPGAGPSRPGERPVSPLLLELVVSQQFARRSDGCQAHGSGESALYMFLTDIVATPLCLVTFFLVRAIDQRQTEKSALLERQFKRTARAPF